ncbi:MAG: hypothetical protein COA49_01225 [Bacteroidetes bacterium]|nr:MAG: hypothetical protein COA49_01225 [Bacteroidota bacterium]
MLSLVSCDDHSHDSHEGQSDKAISEMSDDRLMSIETHEDTKRLGKEFHVKLANQFAKTELTDSSFPLLAELDANYVVWSKTLVKIPGTVCDHEEGEEHIHDHAAEARLEKLSDEELLELQKAIQEELMGLMSRLDEIISNK